MATDINSAGECLKAVNILFEELKNAKRSLINSETCTVNRNLMQAQLEFLRDNLPETVEKAAEIVQEEETIRTETEQKRKEILESAQTQAQGMVNDATQKSRQMMEQAQYEANAGDRQKTERTDQQHPPGEKRDPESPVKLNRQNAQGKKELLYKRTIPFF